MGAIHPRSLLTVSLVLAWLDPTGPSPATGQTVPIGEPMPARISYSGTWSSGLGVTLTNESTLEFRLPPRYLQPTAILLSFQVTGTAVYAYTFPANCRAHSEPASGSIALTIEGTRSSSGSDVFGFWWPDQLSHSSRWMIARCRKANGDEHDEAFMPVVTPLLDLVGHYETVDGFS